MNQKDEKWAIFWCDLLHEIIFDQIDPRDINRHLKEIAQKEFLFPDGRRKKPSLRTLRRKLNKYRQGGFAALAKKPRSDRGKPRVVRPEIIDKAVELKKEQPRRPPETINRFLQELYGVSIARSTMYQHLKLAGATRLKLGVTSKKVRKRWTREHTHDLWLGDFEEGPYVMDVDQVVPTHLSGFVDCHSRYGVDARYYLRQNLDILIDSFIRALGTHGAPLEVYLDHAKIYQSRGFKSACYRIGARPIYRPVGDPSPGGLVERFFETVQGQFEAEVRAGDILTLDELNRGFSAWLQMSYHQRVHSETSQTPQERYEQGLTVIRHVELSEVLEAFMQRDTRRVHKDFSDVQLDKRFYRVDPKLRGDKVEVRYDPFSDMNKVLVYSLEGMYLCEGLLHNRETAAGSSPSQTPGKPQHNYVDLLIRQHDKKLEQQARGIDYSKVIRKRAWPFNGFVKTLGRLLGRKGELGAFTAGELESLRKIYNRNASITEAMLKEAFQKAEHKTIAHVGYELQQLANRKEGQG